MQVDVPAQATPVDETFRKSKAELVKEKDHVILLINNAKRVFTQVTLQAYFALCFFFFLEHSGRTCSSLFRVSLTSPSFVPLRESCLFTLSQKI